MIDRENAIIRTIEAKFALAESMEQHELWITLDVMREILALLKEQEAKPVLSVRYCETLPNHYERKGFCPKCHQVVKLYLNRSYCGFCGQAVKWE